MSSTRALLVAAVAASLAACAGTKSMKPSTEVIDAAPAPAPVAEVAAPVPGACSVDADCGSGERCDAGRCALAPASTCELVRVAFAFDSAQLDQRSLDVLRDNARCIAERRAAAILIEGHADERGTVQYNVALGARRAEAVRRYFADLGVKARLETVSFGEEIPLVRGAGEQEWAQNRRAELRLPGERRSDGMSVSVQ